MKLLKLFEYIYILLFVFSLYIVGKEWNADRSKSYIFIVFAIITLAMFFFRRYYRVKFEQRKNSQNQK